MTCPGIHDLTTLLGSCSVGRSITIFVVYVQYPMRVLWIFSLFPLRFLLERTEDSRFLYRLRFLAHQSNLSRDWTLLESCDQPIRSFHPVSGSGKRNISQERTGPNWRLGRSL